MDVKEESSVTSIRGEAMWIRSEKGDLHNVARFHGVELSQRSRFAQGWAVVAIIQQGISPLQVELFQHKNKEVVQRVMNQIVMFVASSDQLFDLRHYDEEAPQLTLAASAS